MAVAVAVAVVQASSCNSYLTSILGTSVCREYSSKKTKKKKKKKKKKAGILHVLLHPRGLPVWAFFLSP